MNRVPAAAAALVLATLFVLAPACGRKGPVRAPQLVVPEPITDLAVRNDAEGIVLTWSRPERYVDATSMKDLGGFVIERGQGPAGEFDTTSMLPVMDRDRFRQIRRFRYVDTSVEMGTTYRYRVVSRTTDGYASSPSNVVEIARELPPPAASAATPGSK